MSQKVLEGLLFLTHTVHACICVTSRLMHNCLCILCSMSLRLRLRQANFVINNNNNIASRLSSTAPASWACLSGFTSGGVTKVRSLSGLNGILGPLVKPKGALTVSSVMPNARGVVMVRWVRKMNPMLIKQFIYMYLQRRISASGRS